MEKKPATLIKLSEYEIRIAIAYWLNKQDVEYNKVAADDVELYVKPITTVDGEAEYYSSAEIILK